MLTTLKARRLLTAPLHAVEYPTITMEDGLIVAVEAGEANSSTDTLTSAFFDVHVHGAVSHDFMAASVREIEEVGRFLARQGVAHYLPTTVTGPIDKTLRALETLAGAIEAGATPQTATPVGIHLEGPFVSHVRRGVQPEAYLLEPSIALFERFQVAARGHIALVTLAPELPQAIELITHATAAGVRISMGHSDATQAQALAGISAGATGATHTFNGMRPLSHREPGVLGVVLDREDIYAEAICDGVHVDPTMVRLWLKMKGEERAILITDGMSATGMPDGDYRLGDLEVHVAGGVCLSGGVLAGSVLTMAQAVANVQRFTATSLGAAVQMASRNPARMLGREELVSLAPGAPANFNVYDEAGTLRGTMLHGQYVS